MHKWNLLKSCNKSRQISNEVSFVMISRCYTWKWSITLIKMYENTSLIIKHKIKINQYKKITTFTIFYIRNRIGKMRELCFNYTNLTLITLHNQNNENLNIKTRIYSRVVDGLNWVWYISAICWESVASSQDLSSRILTNLGKRNAIPLVSCT